MRSNLNMSKGRGPGTCGGSMVGPPSGQNE